MRMTVPGRNRLALVLDRCRCWTVIGGRLDFEPAIPPRLLQDRLQLRPVHHFLFEQELGQLFLCVSM